MATMPREGRWIFPKVTEKVDRGARKRSKGSFDPPGSIFESRRDQRPEPQTGKDKEP